MLTHLSLEDLKLLSEYPILMLKLRDNLGTILVALRCTFSNGYWV